MYISVYIRYMADSVQYSLPNNMHEKKEYCLKTNGVFTNDIASAKTHRKSIASISSPIEHITGTHPHHTRSNPSRHKKNARVAILVNGIAARRG